MPGTFWNFGNVRRDSLLAFQKWILIAVLISLPALGKVKVEDVEYFSKVKGYLATPGDGKKHPAIILIHEWWGLNDQMKVTADRLAQQGYIAFAVDLYEGKSTTKPEEAGKLASAVRSNMPRAFDNLKAAVALLSSRTDVDAARTAAIGWCFGGGWALEMAKNDLGVKASVIYYGHFDPKDDFSKMRAAIQGHFGAQDKSIHVDGVKEFEASLKTHGKVHEIFIYPNGKHGFFNEQGKNYSKAEADLAWKRTLDFLKRRL